MPYSRASANRGKRFENSRTSRSRSRSVVYRECFVSASPPYRYSYFTVFSTIFPDRIDRNGASVETPVHSDPSALLPPPPPVIREDYRNRVKLLDKEENRAPGSKRTRVSSICGTRRIPERRERKKKRLEKVGEKPRYPDSIFLRPMREPLGFEIRRKNFIYRYYIFLYGSHFLREVISLSAVDF